MKPLYGKKEIDAAVQRIIALDDSSKIFFGRQLEHLKSQSYDVKYPELQARMFFQPNFSADPGAKTITYEQYDSVGIAKFLSSYGDDLPRVDLLGKEVTVKVKPIGAAYGWSIDDIRAAARKGMDLTGKKSQAARRAVMTREDLAAWYGDDEYGIVGFLNNPNVGTYTVINDGTGSSTEWADKDPDKILRDLNGLVNSTDEATLGTDAADTVLLPRAKYNYINSTRASSDSDKTILQLFKMNNTFVKNVFSCNRLTGAGAGGTDRMVALRMSPEHISMEIPQEYEEFPPQEKNLEAVVPCHSKFAGVLLFYPLSVAFGDGI